MPDSELSFEALSESALLLNFPPRVDADTNGRVHRLWRALRQADLPGIEGFMPAYASLLLRFDPDAWSDDGNDSPHVRLWRAIEPLYAPQGGAGDLGNGKLRELPVCYGGEFGADLKAVADRCGLSTSQLIESHSAPEYRVAMLGFAPGFAYLLGLDPALHVPRRATPRTRVPAGSVGIGGAQTGIYPRQLPGGWQLLGRTSARLFDPDKPRQPTLLQPGDRVRFKPVDADRFAVLEAEGPHA